MVKAAAWLSGLVPFAYAEEILAQIGQVQMSTSSIWRYTQEVGKRFSEVETQWSRQASAPPVKWMAPEQMATSRPRMGVAMDGTMMHIRQEGWKELKVGTVFEVAMVASTSQKDQDQPEQSHAVHTSYMCHLGSPKRLGDKMWAEASQRGWDRALDTQVIGDGASWIWNLAQHHFGYSRQSVDWYHAKSHLAAAARLLHGEETTATQRWLKSRETLLYQGHADRIAQELLAATPKRPSDAEELRQEATYFRNNQRRMAYLEMREEGWLIGSGMVESGGKQYKDRVGGAGMRWSRPGAERLLPIRTAILSNRFNQLWHHAHYLPRN